MGSKRPGPLTLDLRSALVASSSQAGLIAGGPQLSPLSPSPSSPGDKLRTPKSANAASPQSQIVSKSVYETRKLLQYLLDGLNELVVGSNERKGKERAKQRSRTDSKGSLGSSSEDSDTEGQAGAGSGGRKNAKPAWGAQALMLTVQLRDLFLMNRRQSWNLFTTRCIQLLFHPKAVK